MVTPATVLRWQRRRFRAHWTKLSRRPAVGRPPVNAEIRTLVTRMAAANSLWGAPRIHGELLKLGLEVAERTVSRLMPKRRTPPPRPGARSSPTSSGPRVDRLLHRAHRRLRVLFVLVVLAHQRRPVVHFNVTEHPTAHWTAQQIVQAFRMTPGRPTSCAIVTRSTARSFGIA